jgi:hypothetical protein
LTNGGPTLLILQRGAAATSAFLFTIISGQMFNSVSLPPLILQLMAA